MIIYLRLSFFILYAQLLMLMGKHTWPHRKIKMVFPGMWISVIKIRQSWDCLIFIMGVQNWSDDILILRQTQALIKVYLPLTEACSAVYISFMDSKHILSFQWKEGNIPVQLKPCLSVCFSQHTRNFIKSPHGLVHRTYFKWNIISSCDWIILARDIVLNLA